MDEYEAEVDERHRGHGRDGTCRVSRETVRRLRRCDSEWQHTPYQSRAGALGWKSQRRRVVVWLIVAVLSSVPITSQSRGRE